jgi:hypothetical protein
MKDQHNLECPHPNTRLLLILYAFIADKVQTKSQATLRHLSVTNIASQFRIATDICSQTQTTARKIMGSAPLWQVQATHC